ncbi:hypothetical protein ANTRET_LOCUS2093 [Anthophora retusa]
MWQNDTNPIVRKKHEYLDSYPSVRLVASCRTTMRSDCYCNTCVPIERQREEIHSERSRAKSSRSSFAKTETVRSAKKISLTPAKVVDDVEIDNNRSTLPVPLILSPETSAAIEDVEKLIKDAEIRMKEISMAASSGDFKRTSTDVYEGEAPLDDENDQLLYIRERVTYKFQEANGWIDTYCTSSKSQQFTREEENLANKFKRAIDLSAPKFKTSEERYREFSQRRKYQQKQLELLANSNEKTRSNDEACFLSRKQENEANRKFNSCSVQTGPSVDIKGEMITQNLESIHISPDPCFVQESQNVGTYVFYRDSFTENAPPRRKEKFVRILGGNNEDNKNEILSINGEQKKKHSKELNEIETNNSDFSQVPEKSEKFPERSRDVSTEVDEGVLNIEKTRDKEESLARNHENKTFLEDNNDRSKNRSTEKSFPIVTNVKQEVDIINQVAEDSTIKLVSKNEQKQVRFDEQALRTEDNKSRVDESRGEKEDRTILKEDLNASSNSIEAEEGQSILKNNTVECKYPSSLKTVQIDDKHPLSTKKIEDKRVDDEKRHREICKERRTKKDERYSLIDERFTSILKNYCDPEKRCRKNDSSNIVSSSVDSSEDLEESYDFYNLYKPCIDELDIVLVGYNKVIENVVQSTRMIDKFLSQQELKEYYVKATEQTIDSVIPLKNRKIQVDITTNNDQFRSLKPNRNTRMRETIVKDRVHNSGAYRPVKLSKLEQKKLEDINNRGRKCIVSRNPDKYSVKTELKRKDRLITLGKLDREGTFRSCENSKKNRKMMEPNVTKEVRSFETSFYRVENESSTLSNLSMCPASLSTDNGFDNDAKISREISGTSINVHDEALNLKLNAVEIEKGDFDYATFHNVLCSNILTDVFAKMKNTVRGETQFIEDEIKKIFNIKEIAPLIMKTLLESLKNDSSNLENFELLFGKKVLTSNVTSVESNAMSEKQNLQLEYPLSEVNVVAKEMIECDERIVERSIADISESDQKVSIVTDCNVQCNEEMLQSTKGENVSIEEISRVNSNVGSFKENSDTKSGPERNDKNVISQNDEMNLQTKGNNSENLSSRRNMSIAIIEQTGDRGSSRLIDNLRMNSTSLDENEKDTASSEINKMVVTKSEEKTENLMQKGSHLLFPSGEKISETREENVDRSHSSIENTEKTELRETGNNLPHVSLSDSLHDCASLRSSPRNPSKTMSNDTKPSQNINEVERVISPGIREELTHINNSYFDNPFDKEKILSDVYNEIYRKFTASTFDANYSNDRHHRISSTDISTISTVQSNKSETLSDAWQSEGELCVPCSGSYSLGEVRILTNNQNQSDGENTDDFDESITDFITKQILDSCDESSKIK